MNSVNENSFILRFDITQNVEIYKLAQQFYLGEPDDVEVARRKEEYFNKFVQPDCFYWDEPSSSWRKDGCVYHDLLQNELLCKCNHLTFFSSFFKTGIGILLAANIGVLFEVWGKTLGSMVLSYGFYSVAAFWVYFFTTTILIDRCDRKQR